MMSSNRSSMRADGSSRKRKANSSGHASSGNGRAEEAGYERSNKKTVRWTRSTILRTGHFESVLDRPFNKWNEIETVMSHIIPEWNNHQRGCLIRSLLHFLEIKVVMAEYIPEDLLLPSNLVARAWGALILETKLYKRVTFNIQDFHGKERHMIHHSVIRSDDVAATRERLERTQSLFQCYYGERMPTTLDDVETDCMSDASTLTEWGPRSRMPSFPGCDFSSPWASANARTETFENGSVDETEGSTSSAAPWMQFFKASIFGQTQPSESEEVISTVTPESEEGQRNQGFEVFDHTLFR